LAQVEPRTGGGFHKIFDFLSPTHSNEDTILLGTAVLADMVPDSPRPALSTAGPQGSGKSTTAKFIKRLVDPNQAKSIRRIADFRELQLQLEQNWLLNIDNVTSLSPEISDALAAAITGDSDLRRILFTDHELMVLDYMRPMVLNGITHPAQRPDLLDRSILIYLERIAEERRRGEEELWPDFESALPGILGGAFDILSRALAIRPTVRLATRPRMADFAAWGYAIAEAIEWGGPAFLAAYERNINHQHAEAVASSVVAQAVLEFMEERDQWQGPASKLKVEIEPVAVSLGIDPKDRRSGWPPDPARLSKELRRLAETLNAAGVEVTFPHQANKRSIRFRKIVKSTVGTVGTVSSDSGVTDSKRVSADGKGRPNDGRKSPSPCHADGTDGTDGKNLRFSGLWKEEL
jgi:ABC-type oligopeptide transport system ATPase subunit